MLLCSSCEYVIAVQTVTGGGAGVKKKSTAAVKGKKPAASNAEKEEPMEKELSVSCTDNIKGGLTKIPQQTKCIFSTTV